MLPIGGGPVKRGGRREWTDTEDHTDLLLIDLHPFDQGTDHVPTSLKVRFVKSICDFGRKGFQTTQNGPQFLFPFCIFFQVLELLLKVLETLTHTCHSRFKFLFVNQSLGIAIDQTGHSSTEFAHLGVEPFLLMRLGGGLQTLPIFLL